MTEVLIVLIVIGLPVIGGLVLAGYQLWLKHRERLPLPPERLREMERELRQLKRENENLRQRVQNLETIVASVDWERFIEGSFSAEPPLSQQKL
ncbi:MAG: hypothetical protein RMK19_08260 [Bacteroidia bacterium]|nr:hypothetical protein [Bacteroidia bacterium]MDW8015990.1 hypothetical protein [Bacteroidia bacterium]